MDSLDISVSGDIYYGNPGESGETDIILEPSLTNDSICNIIDDLIFNVSEIVLNELKSKTGKDVDYQARNVSVCGDSYFWGTLAEFIYNALDAVTDKVALLDNVNYVGHVHYLVRIQDGIFSIEVEDNGIGLSEESRIDLENRLEFGEDYALSLKKRTLVTSHRPKFGEAGAGLAYISRRSELSYENKGFSIGFKIVSKKPVTDVYSF